MRHFLKDPPDLTKALERLRANGMTLAEIGAAIGVDGDSVGRYCDGTRERIGFVTGWRIMRLYAKTFGRAE